MPYTVHITEFGKTHPITAGIDDFDLVTEQYWVLHDDYNDVLATTTQAVRPWDPWNRPVTSPAIWTRQWGEGRIFVSTPGHRLEIVERPERAHHHREGHCCGRPAERSASSASATSAGSTSRSFPKLPNLRADGRRRPRPRSGRRRRGRAGRGGAAAWMRCSPIRDVDAVLNLTIPAAHAEIALRALDAGKHVYGEKPLALTTAEARAGARRARPPPGLRVGSAPDTVLGTGVQTARALLDDGRIGAPVAAAVAWSAPGHELWHPAPAFYYQPGGGPLFDMGPYYLTSLVTFFGPVVRVSGAVSRSSRRAHGRDRPAAPARRIPVDVDTHVTAILEHASGVISTVTVSFEVWATRAPLFEVYGTAGTIAVPDPNQFSDTVVHRHGGRTASGAMCPSPPGTRMPGAAWGWPTWPARSRPGGRTAHPASWPSTCSRSWRR